MDIIENGNIIKIKKEVEMANFSKKVFSTICDRCLNKKEEKQNTSTIICLDGNLGSGKTTFTKYFVKNFKIKEDVTSPTFVICKTFDIPDNYLSKKQKDKFKNIKFKKIYHFDMYRLKSSSELNVLNWIEIIDNPENVVLIEWPEIVQDAIPKKCFKLSFEFINKNQRNIKFEILE